MSVLLETSLGDLVIDLDTENCPKACTNFLKLAKTHYYTYNVFFSLQKDFLAQTGDPTESGSGGESVWAKLPASSPAASTSRYFVPERKSSLKHKAKGTVSLACTALSKDEDADKVAGSQFFITLGSDLDYLDGQHAPFGQVVEGQEPGGTLDKINSAFTDESGRPLQDIRIRHIEILDDPFSDPQGLVIPSRPPTPIIGKGSRLADDEEVQDNRTEEEKEKAKRDADTNAAALTLEMVGDLPFAEVRPPENILFVCKLNPVTRSEDLEIFFGRFGKILSCEVIKDKKSGDSLQYAFIEFDKREEAEMAYFKMQNVLIDDRRIWVDFSQSVSNLHKNWLDKRMAGMRGRGQRDEKSRRVASPGSSHNRRSPSPRRQRDESRDDRKYRGSYEGDRRRDYDEQHSRRFQEDRARQGDRSYARHEDRHFGQTDSSRRDYHKDRDQGHSSHNRRW